jgi:hypothetical protein
MILFIKYYLNYFRCSSLLNLFKTILVFRLGRSHMSEHYRLPKNARDFIFNSQLSYSEICKVIEQEHGYKISKGAISYHKRDSPFRSPFYNASGRDHDLSKIDEWEKGYLVGFLLETAALTCVDGLIHDSFVFTSTQRRNVYLRNASSVFFRKQTCGPD